MQSGTPSPTDIVLHTASRVLEISFDDGAHFRLPFEFLRVYSPSADVRGHGPGQETLQEGKRDVSIDSLEPVYAWDYLYELGVQQEQLWGQYLQRLEAAGASRDTAAAPTPARSCGHH